MNIKKLIKEEIVKVLKAINEAPINDPLLKKLRTQTPGEKFPELKTWWEYEPEDIMTYVYWHQGQLPPTGAKFEKEWQNIVKQLHRNYPIPASELDRVLPKMDLDDRTERAISVDVPDMGEAKDPYKPTYGTGDVVHDCPKHVQETISGKKGKVVAHSLNESGQVNYVDVDFGTGKVYHDIPTKKLKILEGQTHEHVTKSEPNVNEDNLDRTGKPIKGFKPGDMWRDDFDYTGMLKYGANAPEITFDNLGEMQDLHASFTDVNYHTEARDLGNALEWAEDTGPDEPKVLQFMKMFRAACAKTLKDIERR